MKTIKLGIADDHRLFRKILKDYLSQQPFLHTVIEADNVNDLFTKLDHASIEILIIDVLVPDINGRETLKAIRSKYPDLKVIVLSMSMDIFLINELLDIGIHAYISKADQPESLLQAIISASEDKIYRSKSLTDALYQHTHLNLKRSSTKNHISLDERERKILQLLWEEKSNKDIANEIFLSVRSVEKIRQDLKEKLGVKSTIGLIKYALSNNIIVFNNKPTLNVSK
jgi:DNA-binding NarL/FixJ family response regulator